MPPGNVRKAAERLAMKRLSFVHVAYDVQLREPLMRDLLRRQGLGNHPDGRSTGGKDRVRNDSHQADPATPINQSEPVLGNRMPDPASRFSKSRVSTRGRPAVHAQVLLH